MSVTAQETLYTTELVNVFYSYDKKQLVDLNSVSIFYAIQGAKTVFKKKYYIHFSMKNFALILLGR